MRITLLYFAAARERTGKGSEIVELPEGATAGDAREAACAAHPPLRAVADKLRLAVDIAAAAPHRADAFEACRHAIEELKRDAPIWKREHYPDGSVWVGMGS